MEHLFNEIKRDLKQNIHLKRFVKVNIVAFFTLGIGFLFTCIVGLLCKWDVIKWLTSDTALMIYAIVIIYIIFAFGVVAKDYIKKL